MSGVFFSLFVLHADLCSTVEVHSSLLHTDVDLYSAQIHLFHVVGTRNTELYFCWVPGHCGIPGNQSLILNGKINGISVQAANCMKLTLLWVKVVFIFNSYWDQSIE